MKRLTTLAAGMAAGLFALAGSAFAIPPIMDRVPAGAPIVIVIPSIEKAEADANSLLTLVGQPPMANADMALTEMGLTGINKKGAIALVMLKAPDPETGKKPPMVLVFQAEDYAGFTKSISAAKDGELDKATIQEKDHWLKSLGGGFVALSDDKDIVAKFDGKEGGNARHKKFYGSRADKLTEGADAAVFLDMVALKPLIDAGSDELEQRLGELSGLSGGADPAEMIGWIKDHLVGDMDSTVAAFSIDASGVSFDVTGVAKEGSKLAGALETAGKAHALLNKVPGGQYLFAYAADMSNKGWSNFFKDMPKGDKEGGLTSLLGNDPKLADKATGVALVVGVPPGGFMSGLLTRTYGFMQTSEPEKVVSFYKDDLPKLLEKEELGKVEYKSAVTEVEGKKVDSIDMTFAADEGGGVPLGQIMQGMFGVSGGPSMYVAQVDGGLVATMSKSSEMMATAIKASKGEGTLASDKQLAAVAEKLPSGRSVEAYIGVKSLLETALQAAATFGNKQFKVDIPEKLPPIATGVAMGDRQLQATLYVPADVIKTGAALAKAVQSSQMGEDEEAPVKNDDEKGEKKDDKKSTPKF